VAKVKQKNFQEPLWNNIWVRLSKQAGLKFTTETDVGGAEVMSPGRLFQTPGPATANIFTGNASSKKSE